LKIKWKPSRMK